MGKKLPMLPLSENAQERFDTIDVDLLLSMDRGKDEMAAKKSMIFYSHVCVGMVKMESFGQGSIAYYYGPILLVDLRRKKHGLTWCENHITEMAWKYFWKWKIPLRKRAVDWCSVKHDV